MHTVRDLLPPALHLIVDTARTLQLAALAAGLAGAVTLLLTWQGVIANRGIGLVLALGLFIVSSFLTVRAGTAGKDT